MTLVIPTGETEQGHLSKRTKNGHSIVIYRRTEQEMDNINTNQEFMVFEGSQCLITVKNKDGKKHLESAKTLYDNCGIKYNISGKALSHIPFVLTNNTIVVNHGYFEWW